RSSRSTVSTIRAVVTTPGTLPARARSHPARVAVSTGPVRPVPATVAATRPGPVWEVPAEQGVASETVRRAGRPPAAPAEGRPSLARGARPEPRLAPAVGAHTAAWV